MLERGRAGAIDRERSSAPLPREEGVQIAMKKKARGRHPEDSTRYRRSADRHRPAARPRFHGSADCRTRADKGPKSVSSYAHVNDTDITNLVSVYVNQLLLALGSMFVQQTFVALGRALPAVIAPAIITDLRIDAAWVGIYFGLTATASLVAQLGCGSFIVRHGALRMNQVSLVMVAAGTALAAVGTPPMLILSAIICGSGGSVSTPAS